MNARCNIPSERKWAGGEFRGHRRSHASREITMPTWWATATEAQKAHFRAAISEGQRRAWQRGRKGNHRRRRGREPALEAQGLPPGCARFYWLARMVFGYHNSHWDSAKMILLLKLRDDVGPITCVMPHKKCQSYLFRRRAVERQNFAREIKAPRDKDGRRLLPIGAARKFRNACCQVPTVFPPCTNRFDRNHPYRAGA
jgi:hypothetical protein